MGKKHDFWLCGGLEYEICDFIFVKHLLINNRKRYYGRKWSQLILVTGASLLLWAGSLQVLGIKVPLRFPLLSSYGKNCWNLKIHYLWCTFFPCTLCKAVAIKHDLWADFWTKVFLAEEKWHFCIMLIIRSILINPFFKLIHVTIVCVIS